jgi:hypothetical protein
MRNYTLLKAGGGIAALAFALLVSFLGTGFAAPKTDRETKIKPLVGTYTAAQVEKSCTGAGGTFSVHTDGGGYGCVRSTGCKGATCYNNQVSCTPNGRCFGGEFRYRHPPGSKGGDSTSWRTSTPPIPTPKPSVPPATVSTGTFSTGPFSTGVKTAAPVKLPEIYSPKPQLRQYP